MRVHRRVIEGHVVASKRPHTQSKLLLIICCSYTPVWHCSSQRGTCQAATLPVVAAFIVLCFFPSLRPFFFSPFSLHLVFLAFCGAYLPVSAFPLCACLQGIIQSRAADSLVFGVCVVHFFNCLRGILARGRRTDTHDVATLCCHAVLPHAVLRALFLSFFFSLPLSIS